MWVKPIKAQLSFDEIPDPDAPPAFGAPHDDARLVKPVLMLR